MRSLALIGCWGGTDIARADAARHSTVASRSRMLEAKVYLTNKRIKVIVRKKVLLKFILGFIQVMARYAFLQFFSSVAFT